MSETPSPLFVINIRQTGFRLGVNVADADDLLDLARVRLQNHDGFALATVNLDHLEKLRHPGPFTDAYAAQDFVVADGNPIVWLSRLAGRPVSLVPGSDMVLPMAAVAVETDTPVALLGSTQEALAASAEALKAHAPGLNIVGTFAPPFPFDPGSAMADDLLDEVAATGARLVYLALGAPKQEILAARGRARAPQLGFVSIGAGLDFLAGTQTRAPKWVRKLAMEWVWRMLTNPRRLAKRYALSAVILPGLAIDALRQRWGKS
ncbi:WecB/TagA/CpsF family glycosyltransferase [Loktanella sp. Alg231-35]|uniref:WecB/TagA/CpsF family glycosyltransferase n=1 Tax=Loktanella sp. Alg231-35 TaxID=1922220 RepID=UPI002795E928|nr:WecB/TagA/CpsF family glycosyltransferase [Loktanella sp. Alg231-35]